MDRLDALHAFVRVVESGSFTAAARERGVGQSAVSKQVAALEAQLGAPLIRRTTRSLALTEAGRECYDFALQVLGDFEDFRTRLAGGQASPTGRVRLSGAPVFCETVVTPRLAEFNRLFPGIVVELVVTDRMVNFVEEDVDLSLFNGEVAATELIVRRIAASAVVTVATPGYLARRGVPASVAELEGHDCVAYSPQGAPRIWRFAGGETHDPRGPFRSHDARQIQEAALAGLGLAHTPRWVFAEALARGAVTEVLQPCAPPPVPISLVQTTRRQPARVRALADFLARIVREQAERL